MLGQIITELSIAESTLHEWDITDNYRPVPWRTCPDGCGCRYGTMDADHRECACAGPCCGGDDDTWFSLPFTELSELAVNAIITLLHLTHDPAQVGQILVDRTRSTCMLVANAKRERERKHRQNTPQAANAQRAWRDAHFT
jgi:hypothetical protein